MQKTDTFEYYVMEHLRMSGVYWAVAAMSLLDAVDDMKKDEIVDWGATVSTFKRWLQW